MAVGITIPLVIYIKPEPIVSKTSYVIYKDDDGEEKLIDLPYNNKNLETLQSRKNANTHTYAFDTNSDGQVDTDIDSSKIQKIVFGKQWSEVTELGDYFCSYMFYDRKDINIANVDFSSLKNVKTVGNYFANNMFTRCSNLKMNSIFNLPPNITEVGHYFASNMFRSCSGLETNSVFNLPQNITKVGSGFASSMFSNCQNLKKFNITIKKYSGIATYQSFLNSYSGGELIVQNGTIGPNGTPMFDPGSDFMIIKSKN